MAETTAAAGEGVIQIWAGSPKRSGGEQINALRESFGCAFGAMFSNFAEGNAEMYFELVIH